MAPAHSRFSRLFSIAAAVGNVVDASPQSSVRSWTKNDVKSWLEEVGLGDRSVPKRRGDLERGYECTVCEKQDLEKKCLLWLMLLISRVPFFLD